MDLGNHHHIDLMITPSLNQILTVHQATALTNPRTFLISQNGQHLIHHTTHGQQMNFNSRVTGFRNRISLTGTNILTITTL